MTKLGVLVAAVLSLCAMAIGIYSWLSLRDGDMTVNGYVAMALAGLGMVVLAGSLMALLFYSHRAGYDDRAGKPLRRKDMFED